MYLRAFVNNSDTEVIVGSVFEHAPGVGRVQGAQHHLGTSDQLADQFLLPAVGRRGS